MSDHNSAVGIFGSHLLAEDAVRELQRSGLDTRKLSIVGKDQHADEHVVGCYNAGERMMYWSKRGAVSVGLWGVLLGAGFFWVPGLGPLLVAGPLITKIVDPPETPAAAGGLSAVGAGLNSMGIPKDSVVKYETAIKRGTFVLIYHGTAEEVEKSREVLDRVNALETALHVTELAAVA